MSAYLSAGFYKPEAMEVAGKSYSNDLEGVVLYSGLNKISLVILGIRLVMMPFLTMLYVQGILSDHHMDKP